MNRILAFSCRAAAEATSIAADVVSLRTEGFYNPSDNGGADYRRVSLRPSHGGCLRSADGTWWEICGRDFSVRQFGALGDGISDDSDALQAALDCPLATALRLPAGRYRATGLSLQRDCLIVGEAAELFWDLADDPREMLNITSSSASVRGVCFSGGRYVDLTTPVGPYTLLRIDPMRPEEGGEVRLQDLTFIGGSIGCVVGLVSNVFLDRLRFEHCRDFGLILARGPRQIIINGLIATGIGGYGGIKTDFAGTVRATERLVVNDFVITDCGRGSSSPKLWQEGIDLDCGFAREWVISNGVISNCGGGGICLKTGGVLIDEDDLYQDMIVSNLVISVRGNRIGICLEWTGPKVNSGKRGRRILVTGNTIRHEGATNTGGCGIQIAAWSDVHIANNYIEGAHAGLILGPTGSSDDTARDVSIANNRVRGAQFGIITSNGVIETLDVSGNVIDCGQIGIQFAGARCRDVLIAHNRISQRGRPDSIRACIQVRNCREMEVSSNHLDSEHGNAVMVLDSSYGSSDGALLRNTVRAGAEALHIQGGRWEVFDNYVRTNPGVRTLRLSHDAQVKAAWNIRGLRDVIPLDNGSVGDVALNVARRSSSVGWWFDPTAQDGKGHWAILGAVARREGAPEPTSARLDGFSGSDMLRRLAAPLRQLSQTLWTGIGGALGPFPGQLRRLEFFRERRLWSSWGTWRQRTRGP
jgi:hypothetical protein